MESISIAIVFGCGMICATLIALFRGIWTKIPVNAAKSGEEPAKKKGGKK